MDWAKSLDRVLWPNNFRPARVVGRVGRNLGKLPELLSSFKIHHFQLLNYGKEARNERKMIIPLFGLIVVGKWSGNPSKVVVHCKGTVCAKFCVYVLHRE